MLTFDDFWRVPRSAAEARELPGQRVLADCNGLSSELVPSGTEVLVVRRGALRVDGPHDGLRLLVGLNATLTGCLGDAAPNLKSLALDDSVDAVNELAGEFPMLRDVHLRPEQLQALKGCPLERVDVSGPAGPDDLQFPGLRWLRVCPSAGASAMLRAQEQLEVLDLDLEGASVGRLSLLGPKPNLRRCLLWSGGLKDLSGVEEWRALKELRLQMTGISSLDPLAESTVEELTLVPRQPLDLGPLATAARLRVFSLTVDGRVSSLGDWASAGGLESVVLREVVLDETGLDGLARAPKLRHVLGAPENEAALIRLAGLRPDVVVETFDVHSWDGERDPARNRNIYRTEFGWQFTQNLAVLFDCSTSYDALDRLCASLNPEVRSAAEFDPENAGVTVVAEKLSTVQAVAREIEILAGPR